MKLENAYAEALFQSLKGKAGHEKDTLIKHFFALVSQKGHRGLLSRIAKVLERIEEKSAEKKRVRVFTAANTKAEVGKEILKQFEKNEEKEYIACEDDTLIGGYVLESKDLRVDASHKRALLSFYEKIKAQ